MRTAPPSEFEPVKSIIRTVLADIIIGLPPDKRAEAIEALTKCGILFTPEGTPFIEAGVTKS